MVEFIGAVDMEFDLGIAAKMDALDGKISSAVEKKLTVDTTEYERTISFGWNKDFKKSYDSSEKKEKDKKDPESTEAPKTASEAIKEESKKLEEASDKPDDEKSEEEKKKDD